MTFRYQISLYAQRTVPEVVAALRGYYQQHGQQLPESALYEQGDCMEICQVSARWTAVEYDDREHGSEVWRHDRDLQISRQLRCAGLFVFQEDIGYWGYECFADGQIVDRFVSDASGRLWFAGLPCTGDVSALTRQFPFLQEQALRAYLLTLPDCELVGQERYDTAWSTSDYRPRPGDEFTRHDPAAILNFLRALGVAGGFTGRWGLFRLATALRVRLEACDEETLTDQKKPNARIPASGR